jgi:hypothetical protein
MLRVAKEESLRAGREAQDLSATDEEFIGLAAIQIDEPDEKASVKLSRQWLSALIKYAPALSHLSALCDTDLGQHATELLNAFIDKIEDLMWAAPSEFDVLEGITLKVPSLRCPQTAGAVLRNSSAGTF